MHATLEKESVHEPSIQTGEPRPAVRDDLQGRRARGQNRSVAPDMSQTEGGKYQPLEPATTAPQTPFNGPFREPLSAPSPQWHTLCALEWQICQSKCTRPSSAALTSCPGGSSCLMREDLVPRLWDLRCCRSSVAADQRSPWTAMHDCRPSAGTESTGSRTTHRLLPCGPCRHCWL